MRDWFLQNQDKIAYAAYFDVDGQWPTQIDNNQFPQSQKLSGSCSSADPDTRTDRGQRIFQVDIIRQVIRGAAWLSILIVLLITLVPIGWRPATGLSPNIERFWAMATVGALFAVAYPRRSG